MYEQVKDYVNKIKRVATQTASRLTKGVFGAEYELIKADFLEKFGPEYPERAKMFSTRTIRRYATDDYDRKQFTDSILINADAISAFSSFKTN